MARTLAQLYQQRVHRIEEAVRAPAHYHPTVINDPYFNITFDQLRSQSQYIKLRHTVRVYKISVTNRMFCLSWQNDDFLFLVTRSITLSQEQLAHNKADYNDADICVSDETRHQKMHSNVVAKFHVSQVGSVQLAVTPAVSQKELQYRRGYVGMHSNVELLCGKFHCSARRLFAFPFQSKNSEIGRKRRKCSIIYTFCRQQATISSSLNTRIYKSGVLRYACSFNGT